MALFQGRCHGREARPKSTIFHDATHRPMGCLYRMDYHDQLLLRQLVESAIFGAAQLAKPALIPCCYWLLAALHSPEESRSSLAPFQECSHGGEAGPKLLIFAAFNARLRTTLPLLLMAALIGVGRVSRAKTSWGEGVEAKRRSM